MILTRWKPWLAKNPENKIKLEIFVDKEDFDYEIGRYIENDLHKFPKSFQEKFENLNPSEIAEKLKPSENPLWIQIMSRLGRDVISESAHDYGLCAYLEKGEKLRDLLPSETAKVKKKSVSKVKP